MANAEETRFIDLLRKKRLKYTQERRKILLAIQHTNQHFDADSLYADLKKKRTGISRDTVYRTIPLLLEAGLLQKSVGDGRKEYFEPMSAKGHHDHMVCIQCSKVIEFHSPELEELQTQLSRLHRFQLIFHDHRLFGYCHDCYAKNKMA